MFLIIYIYIYIYIYMNSREISCKKSLNKGDANFFFFLNVYTSGVEIKEKKNICALAYDYALSV